MDLVYSWSAKGKFYELGEEYIFNTLLQSLIDQFLDDNFVDCISYLMGDFV